MKDTNILSGISVGTVFTFKPDFENPDSYKASNVYENMSKHRTPIMEVTVIPDIYGFKNSFSIEMRFIKEDGEYLKDFEWLEYDLESEEFSDLKDWEIRDLNRVFVETDSSTQFLNYLSKFPNCITIK